MAERIVKDSNGREWTCTSADAAEGRADGSQGQDVMLSCSTSSVPEPVSVKVGWQWESMAENGLARIVSQASPVPKQY
ncbi:MAG: hypothetical protein ACXWZS_02070 [Gemmatirosa sp.]